jgi:hypothetical protein
LGRGATRPGTNAAFVSAAARAATRGLLGKPAPVSRSGFVKSHVENGAVNGESTRTTSHEAQTFENMSLKADEQEEGQLTHAAIDDLFQYFSILSSSADVREDGWRYGYVG